MLEHFLTLSDFYQRGCDFLLDFLFPKAEAVREIETADPEAFATKHAYRGVVPQAHALLTYRNRPVRLAIWELKYRKNGKIARLFADILEHGLENTPEHELTGQPANKKIPTITCIPLSEKRLRERGYNQIEQVLRLLDKSRFDIRPELLKRNRHTVPQATLSRAKRLRNLTGCFEAVSPAEIRGKQIILIDDVLTTGSTLTEARKTLLEAGASEVVCIALAH